jgi:hypothetical protein
MKKATITPPKKCIGISNHGKIQYKEYLIAAKCETSIKMAKLPKEIISLRTIVFNYSLLLKQRIPPRLSGRDGLVGPFQALTLKSLGGFPQHSPLEHEVLTGQNGI